jgi:Glycosyltransferase family 9 (heptosyltransferase)
MAIPAIKALKSMGHKVGVLVGITPDDTGALEVMRVARDAGIVDGVFVHQTNGFVQQIPFKDGQSFPDSDIMKIEFDLAILSIPFDGRWQNGVHFRAKRVVDGRTRPDPSTIGLGSWVKHEVEYQMETPFGLGYPLSKEEPYIPGCSFLPHLSGELFGHPFRIYLGVGYKKDAANFWRVKHWGNELYVELIKRLLASDPKLEIVSTGDTQDVQYSLAPIIRGVDDRRFRVHSTSLENSFKIIQSCGMYIGNDTGMAHVAASCGRKVITVHNLENSIVKSHPWCEAKLRRELDGSKTPVTVDQFYQAVKELRDVQ